MPVLKKKRKKKEILRKIKETSVLCRCKPSLLLFPLSSLYLAFLVSVYSRFTSVFPHPVVRFTLASPFVRLSSHFPLIYLSPLPVLDPFRPSALFDCFLSCVCLHSHFLHFSPPLSLSSRPDGRSRGHVEVSGWGSRQWVEGYWAILLMTPRQRRFIFLWSSLNSLSLPLCISLLSLSLQVLYPFSYILPHTTEPLHAQTWVYVPTGLSQWSVCAYIYMYVCMGVFVCVCVHDRMGFLWRDGAPRAGQRTD